MDGEQQELFGARRGGFKNAHLYLTGPEDQGFWYVRLEVFTIMRRDPMVLGVELYGDQQPAPIVGEFAAILVSCQWLKAETVRTKMKRLDRKLLDLGYDVFAKNLGH